VSAFRVHRGGSPFLMSLRNLPMFSLVLCVAGCEGWIQNLPSPSLPSWMGVTGGEWTRIEAWLSCEECTPRHLQGVVGIGPRAAHVLRETLVNLPPDRESILRLRARDVWASVRVDWPYLHEFERHHIENFRARTQLRSGLALVALGFPDDVRLAIDSADQRGYRGDVREGLQDALANHPGVTRFQDGVAGGRLMQIPPMPSPEPMNPPGTWLDEFRLELTEDWAEPSGPFFHIEVSGSSASLPNRQVVPLANHPVVLRRCERSPPADTIPTPGECRSYTPALAETLLTDANGFFNFVALEEGAYEIYPDTLGLGFAEVTPLPGTLVYLLIGPADTARATFTLRR